jgi:osmoprotectant transport system ATP-binding protein
MELGGADVEIRNVSVRRGGRAVIDDVSLTIPSGELVVLLGHSGSGKTTLLSTLNRLVEIDSGRITMDGNDVRSTVPHELRRRVGYCFQGLGLFPHLSVADNVGITPRLLGWAPERIRERTDTLLTLVGLGADFRARLPSELSGGQAQRVAVARALAPEPRLLLLDEPFGALDPETRARLQDELRALQQRLRITTVLVSHDLAEAAVLATRVAVLVDGRIAQIGSAREVIESPATGAVSALIEPARRRARAISGPTFGGEA